MTDNTTPRPWRHETDGIASLDWIEGANGSLVAMQVAPNNAALIVRAVNAHDDLVRALDAIMASLHEERDTKLASLSRDDMIALARAALAKAKA